MDQLELSQATVFIDSPNLTLCAFQCKQIWLFV